MSSEKMQCPLCRNHCYVDSLSCNRGRAMFNVELKPKKKLKLLELFRKK